MQEEERGAEKEGNTETPWAILCIALFHLFNARMAPKRQNGPIATLLKKKTQQSRNEDILMVDPPASGTRLPQGGYSIGCDTSGVTFPGGAPPLPIPIFLDVKVVITT